MKAYWKIILVVILGLILLGGVQHNWKRHFAPGLRQLQAEWVGPPLQWVMINVSTRNLQGDAHLIRTKGEKTILIDVGYYAPAKEQLVPFLQDQAITRIDSLFVTHPHRDHYEGIKALLEAGIKIGEVYFNLPDQVLCDRELPWGCNYQDLLRYHKMLRDAQIPLRQAKAGLALDLGQGAKLDILYAFSNADLPTKRHDINDLSMIMKLRYQGVEVLFTGDLNLFLGKWLAQHGKDLQAEILKVPHHGVAGIAPSAFFRKVAPEAAMVPGPSGLWCSKRGSQVRNWAAQAGVKLYVNGFLGHVTVDFEEEDYSIHSQRQSNQECN